MKIPPNHPRAESLQVRERLIKRHLEGIVAVSGLIAHGRGEAFDYLLGESTSKPALEAISAAVAMLLTAENPVISVNGNTAALVPEDVVRLADVTGSKIEVNLFYRSPERELAIEKLLEKAGAHELFGVGKKASARIPELSSERRCVDPKGILVADVVMVPLEDGDRTEALVKMGKKVIAVDLNPLSRTARRATITIVDNIVRSAPKMLEIAAKLKKQNPRKCADILGKFDNNKNLAESITMIKENLTRLATQSAQAKSQEG
ncbi:MAG TPA: 4-phosphopantoate--beta-alanine ligase [candidate division Zixibacteria bacterium]|nr:4-phosphopantoate--beta-alanine ligase [candidate division Zixibacteria bacterium]